MAENDPNYVCSDVLEAIVAAVIFEKNLSGRSSLLPHLSATEGKEKGDDKQEDNGQEERKEDYQKMKIIASNRMKSMYQSVTQLTASGMIVY